MVSVISAFLFAACGIAAIVGTSLTFPGTPLDRIWKLNPPAYAGFQSLGRTAGVLFFPLCIGAAATAVGLLRGKSWARWLAIALFTINEMGDAASLVITRELFKSGLGVLVATFFLFCLFRPSVILFFKDAG